MPEFIIDHGAPDAAKAFRELDAFTQGYIEAMFFTSTGDPDDAEKGLEHATVAELAPGTMDRIKEDCIAFRRDTDRLLERAARLGRYVAQDEEDPDTLAGRDFWFTRCGHGVGFWDRGLGRVGELLSAHARRFGTIDLYRGDDGLIYLM